MVDKKKNYWFKTKRFLKKTWRFIWYDDSLLSWLINLVLAIVIIKFVIYPGLSLGLGTDLPVVAVISSSMEHKSGVFANGVFICGTEVQEKGRFSLEQYWAKCGSWYEKKGITLEDFQDYRFKNGFNKGDIMLIRGVKLDSLKQGDIIVFYAGKQYPIIHRVISIDLDRRIVETKGDNNAGQITDSDINEQNILEEHVVGKAYARVPWLGYVKIGFSELINLFR